MVQKNVKKSLASHYKNWSEEEEAYLESAWGKASKAYIARRLCRTVRSVSVKACSMGLGGYFDSTGMVTILSLFECFGLTRKTYTRSVIVRNCMENGLPYVWVKGGGRATRMIELDDFWKWAAEHKELLPWYKMEPLILGKEPSWVAEARHESYRLKNRHLKRWDWTEDGEVLRLYKQGKSYEEIAVTMKRTSCAIEQRLKVLKRQRRVKNGLE